MPRRNLIFLLILAAVVTSGIWWNNQRPAPAPFAVGPDTEGWLTYRNEKYGFELKYPRGYYEVTGIRGGRAGTLGDSVALSPHEYNPGPKIYIFLPFARFENSANLQAANLTDYSEDYKAKYLDVIIHQQEEKDINGLRALKQTYSAGQWVDRPGGKVFYARNEADQERWFRYVFFDGEKRFIILKAWNPTSDQDAEWFKYEAFLDAVAATFRFIHQN